MSRPVRATTGCLPHATAHDKRPPACRPPEFLFPCRFNCGTWRGNNFSAGTFPTGNTPSIPRAAGIYRAFPALLHTPTYPTLPSHHNNLQTKPAHVVTDPPCKPHPRSLSFPSHPANHNYPSYTNHFTVSHTKLPTSAKRLAQRSGAYAQHPDRHVHHLGDQRRPQDNRTLTFLPR